MPSNTVYCMFTKFDVNSASHFPFRLWTRTLTESQARLITLHPWHYPWCWCGELYDQSLWPWCIYLMLWFWWLLGCEIAASYRAVKPKFKNWCDRSTWWWMPASTTGWKNVDRLLPSWIFVNRKQSFTRQHFHKRIARFVSRRIFRPNREHTAHRYGLYVVWAHSWSVGLTQPLNCSRQLDWCGIQGEHVCAYYMLKFNVRLDVDVDCSAADECWQYGSVTERDEGEIWNWSRQSQRTGVCAAHTQCTHYPGLPWSSSGHLTLVSK